MPPPWRAQTEELDRLVGGAHHDPHSLLGAHPAHSKTTIRALRPDATAVTALVGDERVPLKKVHDGGVFAGTVAGGDAPEYRLEVT